jgi:hypothetical protein
MKQLNLVAALVFCVFDVAFILAFPLVCLMFLPCLFGGVFWAAAALRELGFPERSLRSALLPERAPTAPALRVGHQH